MLVLDKEMIKEKKSNNLSLNFKITKDFDILVVDNIKNTEKKINVEEFENKMINLFTKSECFDIRKSFLLSYIKTELVIERRNGNLSYFYEL